MHYLYFADINDGNLKIILGFIWCLIIRYQILRRSSDSGQVYHDDYLNFMQILTIFMLGSPKKLLLDWVNNQLQDYPPHIKNFLGE